MVCLRKGGDMGGFEWRISLGCWRQFAYGVIFRSGYGERFELLKKSEFIEYCAII